MSLHQETGARIYFWMMVQKKWKSGITGEGITGVRVNLKFSYTFPTLLHRAKQMARLSRVFTAGIPQHVVQRGNERQVCFANEQDFVVYAGWLEDSSKKYQVGIHAWVFMTNQII